MKTPQQAAKEYATKQCPYYVESDCDGFGDNCNTHQCLWYAVSDWTERANTFLAGAEFATRWISIGDRDNPMPNGQPCLLKDENGRVWTESEFEQERPFVIITHWRSI